MLYSKNLKTLCPQGLAAKGTRTARRHAGSPWASTKSICKKNSFVNGKEASFSELVKDDELIETVLKAKNRKVRFYESCDQI